MDSPPQKKCKESTTITMVVEKWKDGQVEQFSPVQRIGGFPWRLRLYCTEKADKKRALSLVCDKSSEADLWKCAVSASYNNAMNHHKDFASWDTNFLVLGREAFREMTIVAVDVNCKDDGQSWRCRPVLDSLDPRDGILVIGGKKIYVNKESLASQSSYFERLFKGDFKEKNMREIPIGEVEYEEFSNIIRMLYGLDGASLTDENVCRVLELADRFDLKIVEDRVVSYLLSDSPSISIHQKFLIAEQYNLPFLEQTLLSTLTRSEQVKTLSESPEWDLLSRKTITTLFRKGCDLKY